MHYFQPAPLSLRAADSGEAIFFQRMESQRWKILPLELNLIEFLAAMASSRLRALWHPATVRHIECKGIR